MALTDVEVRKAAPREKQYRLTDTAGMYVQVMPNGSKHWRLKYRFGGKEKLLALGSYPEISLAEARKRRDEARLQLSNGSDPGAARKAEKRATRLTADDSFEAVTREWFSKVKSGWTEKYGEKVIRRFELYAFPWIGARRIGDIEPPDLLEVLMRVEREGKHETAHRLRDTTGQVMRYAIGSSRAKRDITADLRDALKPVEVSHFAAITDPAQVGQLLRSIDGYAGTHTVRIALKLAPMLFQRPGELRMAEWDEVDLDEALWVIQPKRMKRRKDGKLYGRPHIVPLPTQAVELLRELHRFTGTHKYVFRGARGSDRPMSDSTINAALRSLGYDSTIMTGHGFRAMARTILDEVLEENVDHIEAQLAHKVRDSLGRAYNRTSHVQQRRAIMQRWADYLDRLKDAEK
ncbi:integrase [Pandoraea captiosa]|uniref:Integrase n=1 Tax=Pandoraea captiosa TaxID=2508302 RepID=A0A5E5ALR3_9BURK|nr:integrase arm-type DNA-binding domain-containing protein [Pandoraea captiosa]VVE74016.1 integrase [Pandoraea captiosa]